MGTQKEALAFIHRFILYAHLVEYERNVYTRSTHGNWTSKVGRQVEGSPKERERKRLTLPACRLFTMCTCT